MRFWYAYIGAFLASWAILVAGLGLFGEVARQWPIALVMILGSLVAGATPMGGGAVSFPFLVLWLHIPPDQARDFGLVIQAAGMTSALIYILCRRILIQGRVLVWTIAGAAAGMLLGTLVIAPYVPANFAKLIFACIWMSFAVLTIAKSREFCAMSGVKPIDGRAAMRIGLLVGIIGGIVASIIGVGVEMVLYTVLVLRYRCDLKIAVPTAVSAMAATAVMGVALHLWLGDIPRDIATKFLAAGPVVIFGAPIGAYIVNVIPRARTLYFVSVLGVAQFVWTLYRLERTLGEWMFVLLSVTMAGAIFYAMYRRGAA
jgi:uncharacterized membrane protein YfcA